MEFFVGKNRNTTNVEMDGKQWLVNLNSLKADENKIVLHDDSYDCYDDLYPEEHYEESAGTYVQDVAGYSDEYINDAFDGEPEAYWNID
jgi:hypothetical protein